MRALSSPATCVFAGKKPARTSSTSRAPAVAAAARRVSSRASFATLPTQLSLGQRRGASSSSRITSETFASVVKSSEALFLEAAKHFVKDVAGIKFAPTSGGVNNVVQYVTTADGQRYILRIYNNGFNFRRVQFEHAILKQLESQKLSFKLPLALPTLADPSVSFVKLSNNAEACFFELIPGTLPKAGFAREIGRASGELMVAMGKVQVELESPTAPYWDIYKVHHAVTREKFLATVETEPFQADSVRAPTAQLVRDIVEMEGLIQKYRGEGPSGAGGLPSQLIHGDLHYDNVLVDGGDVSGLLDFEFCAFDWRAMELAICLSKYAGEKDPMPYFSEFCAGFAEHGALTEAEVRALPDLINLRILSNVVYFVGRALAREDGIESLTTRAQTYANRVQWVKKNAGAISELVAAKQAEAAEKRKAPQAA